jgi:YebC/PmpR family DNA-binding regulatory protein
MSGHSKWANIKRKKEAQDAKRGNIFSKMARLISTAVKQGGGVTDPEKNVSLRLALERAKAVNMPKDTIKRAIDKAGGADAEDIKEILFEGFGPGGTGLLIHATTDNTNRTYAEIKQILDKHGGKIAGQNAVAYLFQKCGVVELDKNKISEQDAFTFFDAIKSIDFEEADESYIAYIPFESIGKVKEVLGTISSSVEPKSLDVYYLPSNPIDIDSAMLEKVERLSEKLEDLDDVQNVYNNSA